MRTMATRLVLTVSLAGCSGGLSTGDVEIRTDQRAYSPPETARVTVRNDWHNTLYLTACPLLERRADADWLPAEELICTDNLILLGPDESHQYGRGLNDDLAPGTYRFRIRLSPESAPFRPVDEAFASKAFTVR